jgi:bifunctional DNA-binding transcriptional regulator/antitoxin component of YhaV-PrlF toxin-antitoxin module
MTIAIDSAGRLVVPKAIRDEAELRPDMPLTIRCIDGRIEIQPAAQPVIRVKKGRVAVAMSASGTALSAETVRRTQQRLRGRRA